MELAKEVAKAVGCSFELTCTILKLLDDNEVPFIVRYRADAVENANAATIREIEYGGPHSLGQDVALEECCWDS
jgi:transcriptional accessory protein Tex/SPT6